VSQQGRKAQVVDTNVLIVANRRHNETRACANQCTQALLRIRHSGAIVIDDAHRILEEYRIYCSFSGQPGMGDAFFRWVYNNIARIDLVNRVAITPMVSPPQFFEQFPEHDALKTFDPSDQKFVAVANAHADKPPILQATDSKWWMWKDALRECGIVVEFLCQDEIQQTYERKFIASQE